MGNADQLDMSICLLPLYLNVSATILRAIILNITVFILCLPKSRGR